MYENSEVGTVVKHITRSKATMIVMGTNESKIDCKYWDKEQGDFVIREFYYFELENADIVNKNPGHRYMPGNIVKYIASPYFKLVVISINNGGASYQCSFWNPIKKDFEEKEFYGYELIN